MSLVAGGAGGSKRSLLIAGKVAPGRTIAWAGAMFCPGKWPFEPANLSSKRTISFQATGDGQTYAVMIYAKRKGFIPGVRTFVAGRKWQEFTFDVAAVLGMEPSDVTAVIFGRSPKPGKFKFRIDDVKFTSTAKPTPAQPSRPGGH